MDMYEIVDGKFNIAQCLPNEIQKRTENQRTYDLVVHLQQKFKERYKIKAFGRNDDHFCTFKGGGDVQIFVTSGYSAAVVHSTGGDEGDEEGRPDHEGPDLRQKSHGRGVRATPAGVFDDGARAIAPRQSHIGGGMGG